MDLENGYGTLKRNIVIMIYTYCNYLYHRQIITVLDILYF